jgi:polar amino acid transport system ATP-binding protein
MESTYLVEAVNVHKNYGKNEVLKGVSLSVPRQEVLCLIGPSGSGKSTFLRCVNHLEKIDSGEISVDSVHIGYEKKGDVLHELPQKLIAKQRANIGMVFQNFNLFQHMSVVENVMFAPMKVSNISAKEARIDAIELLEKVGLASKIDSYPKQLSGGQQQRVAIARALAMKPKLLLFDEPTSALDPELVDDVLGVIRGLAKSGMTMIIVTHEIAFASEIANLVAFMDEGRIMEIGTPDEVLNNPKNARTQTFLARVLR